MNFVINHYGWGQRGPFPSVSGELTANAREIAVQFDVREPELRAVHSIHNEMVCEDSCVEFFCTPCPDDPRYLNIEINPVGAVHFAIGEGRHNRTLLPERHIYALRVQTTVDRGGDVHWTARFFLPRDLVTELYGKPIGNIIRCNFYKCGDFLKNPHWGSWAPVQTQQPDFHRPEFFREVPL